MRVTKVNTHGIADIFKSQLRQLRQAWAEATQNNDLEYAKELEQHSIRVRRHLKSLKN